MAGHASNWFKSGSGSAKGKVFISNAAIAKMTGTKANDTEAMKAAKSFLSGTFTGTNLSAWDNASQATFLGALAGQSVQPKGQALAKPSVAPEPAAPAPKAPKVYENAEFLKSKGIPFLDKKPKTAKGTVFANTYDGKKEAAGDEYVGTGLIANKDPSGNAWSVTHQASGQGIVVNLKTKKEAQLAAESLIASGFDWNSLNGDNPGGKVMASPQWPTIKEIVNAAKWGGLNPKNQTASPYNTDPTANIKNYFGMAANTPASIKAKAAYEKQQAKAKAAADKLAAALSKKSGKKPTAKELGAMALALKGAQKIKSLSATMGVEAQFSDMFRRFNLKGHLDSNERMRLDAYQGSSYKGLNSALWKGAKPTEGGGLELPGSYRDFAQKLMSASKKLSAPFNFTTYRAVNANHPLHEWAQTVQPGALYRNLGFDSTSIDPGVVPVGEGGGSTATRIIFEVPKGSKGIYLNGAPGYNSSIPHEMEWLSPANSNWQVTGVRTRYGVREVVVQLLGQRDFDGNTLWP